MLQNAADTQVSSFNALWRMMNIGPIVPAMKWKSNHIVFEAIHLNTRMRRKIGYTAAITISPAPISPQYTDRPGPGRYVICSRIASFDRPANCGSAASWLYKYDISLPYSRKSASPVNTANV